MKYAIALSVLLILGAVQARAQSYTSVEPEQTTTDQNQDQENAKPAYSDRYFGLQLGPNLTSAASTPNSAVPYTSSRARLSVGGFADFTLFRDNLFFQPELSYVQRGFSVASASGRDTGTTVNLNYLDFAFLLKARVDSGSFKPFVLAGPAMGVLLSKSASTTIVRDGELVTVPELGLEGTIGSLSLSFNVGAGLDFELTKTLGAFFGLRYSLGLSNIVSDATTESANSVKNNGLQLLGGIQLAI